LTAIAAMVGLLLICCIVGWFFGIPRLQDNIADSISHELSTEVANQLDSSAGNLQPGTHTISVAQLQSQIDQNLDDSSTSDFGISVDANGIEVGFTSGTQDFSYSGKPVAEDGKLVIEDMETSSGWLGRIMPADKVANIIEDGINDYFAARNQEIQSIQLGNDKITFTTVSTTGE
jgi:hypothetical protein